MHGENVGQTFLECIFGIFCHLDAAVSENSKVPHQLESTNDNLFSLPDNAIRQLNKLQTITTKLDVIFNTETHNLSNQITKFTVSHAYWMTTMNQ